MRFRLAAALFGTALAGLWVFPAMVIAAEEQPAELHDLFYGEALFFAYQDQYFEAITTLDSELKQHRLLDDPELDSFTAHVAEAEFSVGDLELSYRMHREAGRAIEAVLKGDVAQPVRNKAAYRLAKIHYHKQQPLNALQALEMIEGQVPEPVRAQEQFLRARVLMQLGRFNDAVGLLEKLKTVQSLSGFVEFNLGIALLKAGQQKRGVLVLDELGRQATDDAALQALKDKTNLLLGSHLMESGELGLARSYFDRVKLSGPFSNKALLGAGWVEARAGRYDRALVPWKLLQSRRKTNKAVQEAMLAVPYAYGKLDVHSTAAIYYGQVLNVFGREIDVLTTSINSIREGKFLEALRRKEAPQVKNWVVALRALPGAPETHYLLDLMASNDYQEFLHNYRDLNTLFERNANWLQSLVSFEDLIAMRSAYYEPILPGLDQRFRQVDARIKLSMEERQRLAERIDQMLVSRRPEFLANSDEQQARLRLKQLQTTLARNQDSASDETKSRIARLEGVLTSRLANEYDQRLTVAYKHLRQLDQVIAELQLRYQSYVRSRQAATHSYQGYSAQIHSLRSGLQQAQQNIETLMARQGKMLETLAVNELDHRRAQLGNYQIKARFSLADSYDRANALQEQRLDQQKIERHQSQRDQARDQAEPVTIPVDNPPELEPPQALGEDAQ